MFPDDLDAPEPIVPLAWEAPESHPGLLARAVATGQQLLGPPDRSGRALGSRRDLGPAVSFFSLAGLPCLWAGAVSHFLAEQAHPERLAKVAEAFRTAAPNPALARVLGLAQLVAYPVLVAIGILVAGVLIHLGLWLTGALVGKRGIDVTFRGLLYLAGATGWLMLAFSLAAWLPTGWLQWLQIPYLAVVLGVLTQLGRMLAHAHGAETWRGVLGVFLPCLVCCCLCLGALGLAGAVAAKAAL